MGFSKASNVIPLEIALNSNASMHRIIYQLIEKVIELEGQSADVIQMENMTLNQWLSLVDFRFVDPITNLELGWILEFLWMR